MNAKFGARYCSQCVAAARARVDAETRASERQIAASSAAAAAAASPSERIAGRTISRCLVCDCLQMNGVHDDASMPGICSSCRKIATDWKFDTTPGDTQDLIFKIRTVKQCTLMSSAAAAAAAGSKRKEPEAAAAATGSKHKEPEAAAAAAAHPTCVDKPPAAAPSRDACGECGLLASARVWLIHLVPGEDHAVCTKCRNTCSWCCTYSVNGYPYDKETRSRHCNDCKVAHPAAVAVGSKRKKPEAAAAAAAAAVVVVPMKKPRVEEVAAAAAAASSYSDGSASNNDERLRVAQRTLQTVGVCLGGDQVKPPATLSGCQQQIRQLWKAYTSRNSDRKTPVVVVVIMGAVATKSTALVIAVRDLPDGTVAGMSKSISEFHLEKTASPWYTAWYKDGNRIPDEDAVAAIKDGSFHKPDFTDGNFIDAIVKPLALRTVRDGDTVTPNGDEEIVATMLIHDSDEH